MPYEPLPCHHDKDLLLAGAEGRLSRDELAAVEAQCAACPECAADYRNLCRLHQAAAAWTDVLVPEWNRSAALPPRERARLAWPQWFSLAASCAALFLALGRVDVASTEQGWRISLGGEAAPAVAAADGAALARQFKDFELKQAAYLEQRLAEQDDVNRDTLREVVKAVAQQNRRERRQDLESLLTYWQAQRESESERLERRLDSVSNRQSRDAQALEELLDDINETQPVKTESL
jgi:anti-sigma factor RsiW